MRKQQKKKNNSWDNLLGFRYAHRGLFHQPRSASRKCTSASAPQWAEDIARWKASGENIAPENSMKAFRLAVQHGFGSELDVHLTVDGRLAVFHDESLLRMTGIDRPVKDMSWQELSEVRLLDTACPIPQLEEVLDLYTSKDARTGRKAGHFDNSFTGPRDESGPAESLNLPLIIELKEEGNCAELCSRVMELIDRYPTLNYCIESFDPRVVLWLSRHRPEVIRGQLTENYLKSREAVRHWGHLLTLGMWSVAPDAITRPDFIASRYRDRKNLFIRLSHRMGVGQVNWVIRNQKDLDTVEREGGIGIFERFLPDGPQSPFSSP